MESEPSVVVNGKAQKVSTEKGYLVLDKTWEQGDLIELSLPMEGRIVAAHERVEEKTGLRAVQYGPLVYCAEETDNVVDVLEALVDDDTQFAKQFHPELLGGINMLEGNELRLLPYYAWANREVGKMNTWFKQSQ
jgi:hypothetical protein